MIRFKLFIDRLVRNIVSKQTNEITAEERKQIQLEMLSEFDAFCRSHHIRYTLGYGTLLGAVRHKGFIPWDDDVDLVVPLPDMMYLKDHFVSNSMSFVDPDTDKNYEFYFPRISYKRTYQRIGLRATKYGVNMDLYVMIGISEVKSQRDLYYKQSDFLQKQRMRARKISAYLFYLFPFKSFSFLNKAIKAMWNHMLFSPITRPYDEAKCFFCASGFRDDRAIYDYDVFDQLIDAPFENLTLRITSHFDRYLTKEYGDYMKLPPEDERHPYHGGHYYWKE